MGWSFARAALVVVLVSFSASAFADGLFRDMPAADATAAMASVAAPKFPQTVKRSRLAIVDTAYLATRVLPDAPLAAGTKAATKLMPVQLPLFADLSLNLIGTQVEQMADGRVVWTGHVAGAAGHAAILVIDGTSVTGQVFSSPNPIEIRTVKGAVHAITEIDEDAFPDHVHVTPKAAAPTMAPDLDPRAQRQHDHPPGPQPFERPEGRALAPLIQQAVTAAASTTINVYMAYTSAAAAASSNIASEVALAVAGANTAFTNSGVNIQFNLVGSGQISYTEGTYTTSSDILTKFTTNSDGVMDTIHTLRTANSADLVGLIVENLYDACGIAWVYTGDPAYGFTVTMRSCISGYTFAHEAGHNLGSYHDRYVQPEATSNVYSYGYVDTTNRFKTIMSYSDKCTALGISCTTIPYFSNPSVSYNGQPTGIDRSLSTSADTARRFNATASAVAKFRSGTSTPLPESGWWWASTESGRGYSLEVSGNTVFFAFYSYASSGTPVWYVASAAMSDSSTFFSQMQQYSGGQTLSSSYRAASLASNPGYVQISFSNERTATLYFWSSSTGWSSGTMIQRFDFITNGAAIGTATGYPQTGWWWNASEPGRGFFVETQNSAIFVSFYMYNSSGQATWYVASGTMTSSTTFSGTLYEYSGGSYFTASSFRSPTGSTADGTVTIQFSTTTTATLTLPNGTQVPLTRFTF